MDKIAAAHVLQAQVIVKLASSREQAEAALLKLAFEICDELGLDKEAEAGKVARFLMQHVPGMSWMPRLPGFAQLERGMAQSSTRQAVGRHMVGTAARKAGAGSAMQAGRQEVDDAARRMIRQMQSRP